MAAVHTEEQRVFIVRRLAVFDAPEEICADFMKRWSDTRCDHSDVAANDPKRGLIDAKLVAIFNVRRAEFMEAGLADRAPTSEKDVRLIELHGMFRLARARNALGLAADILEQIAKEQANHYAPKGVAATPADASKFEPITSITRTILHAPSAEPAA